MGQHEPDSPPLLVGPIIVSLAQLLLSADHAPVGPSKSDSQLEVGALPAEDELVLHPCVAPPGCTDAESTVALLASTHVLAHLLRVSLPIQPGGLEHALTIQLIPPAPLLRSCVAIGLVPLAIGLLAGYTVHRLPATIPRPLSLYASRAAATLPVGSLRGVQREQARW